MVATSSNREMMWINLMIIIVFGGATLVLQDETFIKWKPTVLYWLFATGLLVSNVIFKKSDTNDDGKTNGIANSSLESIKYQLDYLFCRHGLNQFVRGIQLSDWYLGIVQIIWRYGAYAGFYCGTNIDVK